ncbi:MAG: RDD family protein [Coprobacillus sp.]|nr:RDD family protein [Coprobacillus sp.]
MLEEKRIKRNKLYAALLDGLFIVILSLIFVLPASLYYVDASNNGVVTNLILTLFSLSFVFAFLICFLYLYIPALAFKGETIGMRIFSIQYVDKEGNPLKGGKMALRAIIVTLLTYLTAGLGFIICLIAIGVSHDGRTFYDVIISDKVVSTLA